MPLQRVVAAALHGVVEGVEQLAEGYGGRPQLAGRLVGPAVGDHQLLARGQDRVEHQLPVLAAQVALAGQRGAREHVVAVDGGSAREDAVVQPEQADHAVRHRPHRHHRADGQRAGAEVGPGRLPGEALGHQRAYVGQAQLQLGPLSRGVVGQPAQLALHLAGLPLVAARDGRERLDALAQRVQPVPDRVAAGELVGDVLQPVDQLGEPAGELDAGRPDVVERQRRTDPALGVVGHRHAREHPVEAEAPGVLDVALQAVRRTVLLVVGPADPGLLDPLGDRLEVVLGEPEPAAYRLSSDQVEDRTGLGAATGEVEQLARPRRAAGWSG